MRTSSKAETHLKVGKIYKENVANATRFELFFDSGDMP